jgi:hypothetical protein
VWRTENIRIALGDAGSPMPEEGGQEVTVGEGETANIDLKPLPSSEDMGLAQGLIDTPFQYRSNDKAGDLKDADRLLLTSRSRPQAAAYSISRTSPDAYSGGVAACSGQDSSGLSRQRCLKVHGVQKEKGVATIVKRAVQHGLRHRVRPPAHVIGIDRRESAEGGNSAIALKEVSNQADGHPNGDAQ